MSSTTPPTNNEDHVLRVKNTSDPSSVASAMSHALYDGKRVTLRAIGAGSVNQAVKACAIARGFVASRGIDLSVRPGFTTVEMPDGSTLSAITLTAIADRP